MRLTDYLTGIRGLPFGVSLSDIAQLEISKPLLKDIKRDLSSSDDKKVKMALFFLEGLLPKTIAFDEFLLKDTVIELLPDFLNHKTPKLRISAYELLRILGHVYPNYKNEMIQALKDENPSIRQLALSSFNTYGDKSDIELLIHFEHDVFVSEVRMGSYLVYLLRNSAFELIEQFFGKAFPRNELREKTSEGRVVAWWDWKPIHKLKFKVFK